MLDTHLRTGDYICWLQDKEKLMKEPKRIRMLPIDFNKANQYDALDGGSEDDLYIKQKDNPTSKIVIDQRDENNK